MAGLRVCGVSRAAGVEAGQNSAGQGGRGRGEARQLDVYGTEATCEYRPRGTNRLGQGHGSVKTAVRNRCASAP